MMLSRAISRTSLVSRSPLFLASIITPNTRSTPSTGRRNLSDEPKQAVRKVKKKEKKSKGDGHRPRDLEVILAALDAPVTKPPPLADDEEMAKREKIRKEYTIGKFKQHNEENHDINCKLRLKQHAMKMLPKDSKLKEKAMEIDDKAPPRWRTIPAWTPPIPNFDPNRFIKTEE